MYLLLTQTMYRSFQKFEDCRIKEIISEMSVSERKDTKIVSINDSNKIDSDFILCLYENGTYALLQNNMSLSDKPCAIFCVNKQDILDVWQYDIPIGETVCRNGQFVGKIAERFLYPNKICYIVENDGEKHFVSADELKVFSISKHENKELSKNTIEQLARMAVNIWLS